MNIQDMERFRPHLYDVKDQLKAHVYERSLLAFARGDSERDAVRNEEQLRQRAAAMRSSLIASFGGLPPSDHPLLPVTTGTVRCDGFHIETIIFQSRPETYVTANMYIPEGIAAPRAAVLFLCGHFDQAKHHPDYQAVCIHLARAGLIVLAIDPIGQGERSSYFEPADEVHTVAPGVQEHDYAGAQCWLLGDSIARYFLHDAMRAVDYLQTRPEVDPKRIGVTGNSGGGLQTAMMMVCDPRIAAAAPATFIMNRRSYLRAGQAQDAEQIWLGMSLLGFDHEDILLAMAPRPVLVLAASYDFFPIEGTRDTVARAQRFWALCGDAEGLECFEEKTQHRYSAAMAQRAAAFFAKHLLDSPTAADEREVRTLAPSLLHCTRSGQVRGDYAIARGVFEENADRLDELERKRALMPEQARKDAAFAWLKERIYGSRAICELNPRLSPAWPLEELSVRSLLWWSQPNVMNHGFLFRAHNSADDKLPLTIAVWDSGTRQLHPHLDCIRGICSRGRALLVLDVTGSGALEPNAINGYDPLATFGTIHKLTTDLFWLNDSLAAIRTFDVIRSLELAACLPGIDQGDIQLYAEGKSALYARLACLLDRRFKRVETFRCPDSMAAIVRSRHYDKYDSTAFILPGMLRYFDAPDVDRWLAEDCAAGRNRTR